ncbi:TDP-N-acetylfucosamine:lipid II N-acetylfucosaminyltransferase [Flagellimonas sp. S174]|uniref:TDP-N-acetylfucosamine:lipid II N-acetylfucosaminyltransferase n=1 Tax=Flagellimonas sp. S174 TaxID=3410790 RepID=UPI003BF599D7
MKVLHLSRDEKFIDSVIFQFENCFPKKNDYLIFLSEGQHSKNPKYVKTKSEAVKIIETNDFEINRIKRMQYEYDFICFHGIEYFAARTILALDEKIKIIWFLFGYEVHNNPRIVNKQNNYASLTLKYYKKQNWFKELIRPIYYLFRSNNREPFFLVKKAIERCNYCGILYKEEFHDVKEKVGLDNIEFLKFSYYPIEYIVDEDLKVRGSNILIGNSATATNNHLDVFEKIKHIDLKDSKLIVPLSYGTKSYGDFIDERGKEIFKNSFYPLLDFMPLKDYTNLISSCKIVIMANYRQQAVGNVLAMLYMGAKVYLSKSNTLFSYLKRIGISVFSIEDDLRKDNNNVFKGLSDTEIINNRQVLREEVGQVKLAKELQTFFSPKNEP